MDDEIWSLVEWTSSAACGAIEVSSLGRMRRALTKEIMDPKRFCSERNPFYGKSLYINKKTKSFLIHKEVMAAFVGPRPKGLEIAHLDGDRRNNALSNLKYVTHSENERHKHLHGTAPLGERNPKARLNPDAVRHIRHVWANYKHGDLRRLSRQYGVHVVTIKDVIHGVTWTHVA